MQTTQIQRWTKIGKLHFTGEVYRISLFLNNGETIVNKFCGKSWKNPKSAIQKILEFINS